MAEASLLRLRWMSLDVTDDKSKTVQVSNGLMQILKCNILNKDLQISIISLKYVPYSLIDNKPALVQVMVSALNRRQIITWTKVYPVHWRIISHHQVSVCYQAYLCTIYHQSDLDTLWLISTLSVLITILQIPQSLWLSMHCMSHCSLKINNRWDFNFLQRRE